MATAATIYDVCVARREMHGPVRAEFSIISASKATLLDGSRGSVVVRWSFGHLNIETSPPCSLASNCTDYELNGHYFHLASGTRVHTSARWRAAWWCSTRARNDGPPNRCTECHYTPHTSFLIVLFGHFHWHRANYKISNGTPNRLPSNIRRQSKNYKAISSDETSGCRVHLTRSN